MEVNLSMVFSFLYRDTYVRAFIVCVYILSSTHLAIGSATVVVAVRNR